MSGSSQVMTVAAFAIGFALFGYRISVRHRMLRGVTPWRLPSIVWALICLFLLPLGIIVELVAEFTTRPVLGDAPGASATPSGFPPPSTPPVYPGEIGDPGPAVTGPPPPPNDSSGKTPLFGWYKDTTGRHEQRYWDGRRWSEHVADAGVVQVDPL